jgi:hypothetical protein
MKYPRYVAALDEAKHALERAVDSDTAHAEVAAAHAAVALASEIRAGFEVGLRDDEPVGDDDPDPEPGERAPLSDLPNLATLTTFKPSSFVDMPTDPPAQPRAVAPRPTDFTEPERGGPCPVPGCTTDGSHLHRAWELAEAQGRLTPEAASEWDHDTWLLFIHAHGIQQSEALDAVRARAEAAGWTKPWSLASLAGRPQLCEVLLDLAQERKAS